MEGPDTTRHRVAVPEVDDVERPGRVHEAVSVDQGVAGDTGREVQAAVRDGAVPGQGIGEPALTDMHDAVEVVVERDLVGGLPGGDGDERES